MSPSTYITDHLDAWSSTVKPKTAAGRGKSNGKQELYGIKKLRELILELAVRGLLVPQDPNDEPASELLKQVSLEKTKLINSGQIKKPKNSPPILDNEKPFNLPKNWEWMRLREIGHDWGQKKPDKQFTYIDVSSINKELGIISDPNILEPASAPSRARKIVKEGTVIYSTVRPYLLNIAIIDRHIEPEPIASTAFAIIHPYEGIHPSYIYRYLRSPSFISYVESCQTGIAYPAINDKQFFGGIIPLPPHAEQHRIVAKVDELMALCDQLEGQQANHLEAHQTLVQTLLSALTQTSDAQQFATAWTRIQANFDTLFTTDSSIDQLKQTILQLAVMGKLVPQDPTDEPASELLKKIATEKAQLIKAGKIKKQKPLPPISDDDTPHNIPKTWSWTRLGSTGIGATGKTPKTGNPEFFGGNIQFIGPGQITPEGALLKSDKTLTESGIEESTEALPNDILMVCIGGSIGKSTIASDRMAFNQQINSIRPLFADSKYLNYSVSTPRFYESILERSTGSATPIINRSKWEELLIPLPPAVEQRRIVAKVDELMSLCDALKAKLQAAQTTQVQLTDTLVENAIV